MDPKGERKQGALQGRPEMAEASERLMALAWEEREKDPMATHDEIEQRATRRFEAECRALVSKFRSADDDFIQSA
ncbi:MAG: hypothetical protein AAF533_04600 [Acidobacteriota bacterium]